jgi:hypothetical protein
MADHDNSYKRLFAHADLVRDLLQGFVHEDWVEDIDPETFERVTGTFIGPGNQPRESDMVWRVRLWEGDWLYVYILLEFQATVDPTMALRMMVYVGLLLQELLRQGVRTSSGKLPPVFPVVAYNGNPAWTAALDVADLVDPVGRGLEVYRPRLRYFLLDEAHLGKESLAGRNLMSAVIRLEQGRGPDEMREVVAALVLWLDQPEKADLRRAIAHWIRHVLLPARLPGVRIPEVEDLMEVRNMLEERTIDWTRDWKQAGLNEAVSNARAILERHLVAKFGELPEEARDRLNAIDSLERVMELTLRLPQAPSLGSLGLS